jgi:glycosyltransferase involved in cell wall biosynthesis
MNILLLTNDIDGPGVGYDVKFSKKLLEKKCKVTVFHLGHRHDVKNRVYKFSNKNIFTFYQKFKKIYKKEKIDIAHIRGVISYQHIIWYFCLIFMKAKYVISPNSQLLKFNLNNKLFFENPDFKNDSNNKKKNFKTKLLILYLVNKCVPFFKRLYLILIGNFFIKNSKGMIFYSNYEKINSKKFKISKTIVYEPNLTNTKKTEEVNFKFQYNIEDINIVYWGRLDFKLKGIDRMINLAKLIKPMDKNNKIKFHLMGPDYNNSLKRIILEINKYNLEKKIIYYTKDIWLNNLQPFILADYSILLSKWDGFPRSLRESIFYDLPIIASLETNFGDIIDKTNCGYLIDFNEISSFLKFLENLINNKKKIIDVHKRNCVKAKYFLSDDYYIKTLTEYYKKIMIN